MQRLEVSGAVRPIYESLGVKRLIKRSGVIRKSLYKERIKTSVESGILTFALLLVFRYLQILYNLCGLLRCRIQKLLILNWVRKQKAWTNLMWNYGIFLEELRETQSKFEPETWMQSRKDATTTPRRVSRDRIKFHSKAIKVWSRKGEDCICMNYVLFCIGRISLSWYFLRRSTDAVPF